MFINLKNKHNQNSFLLNLFVVTIIIINNKFLLADNNNNKQTKYFYMFITSKFTNILLGVNVVIKTFYEAKAKVIIYEFL